MHYSIPGHLLPGAITHVARVQACVQAPHGRLGAGQWTEVLATRASSCEWGHWCCSRSRGCFWLLLHHLSTRSLLRYNTERVWTRKESSKAGKGTHIVTYTPCLPSAPSTVWKTQGQGQNLAQSQPHYHSTCQLQARLLLRGCPCAWLLLQSPTTNGFRARAPGLQQRARDRRAQSPNLVRTG